MVSKLSRESQRGSPYGEGARYRGLKAHARRTATTHLTWLRKWKPSLALPYGKHPWGLPIRFSRINTSLYGSRQGFTREFHLLDASSNPTGVPTWISHEQRETCSVYVDSKEGSLEEALSSVQLFPRPKRWSTTSYGLGERGKALRITLLYRFPRLPEQETEMNFSQSRRKEDDAKSGAMRWGMRACEGHTPGIQRRVQECFYQNGASTYPDDDIP